MVELRFLCTALLLNEIWKGSKGKNKQRAITPTLDTDLRILCTACQICKIYISLKFLVDCVVS